MKALHHTSGTTLRPKKTPHSDNFPYYLKLAVAVANNNNIYHSTIDDIVIYLYIFNYLSGALFSTNELATHIFGNIVDPDYSAVSFIVTKVTPDDVTFLLYLC